MGSDRILLLRGWLSGRGGGGSKGGWHSVLILCDRNGRQRDIHFTGDFSKAGNRSDRGFKTSELDNRLLGSSRKDRGFKTNEFENRLLGSRESIIKLGTAAS